MKMYSREIEKNWVRNRVWKEEIKRKITKIVFVSVAVNVIQIPEVPFVWIREFCRAFVSCAEWSNDGLMLVASTHKVQSVNIKFSLLQMGN